MGGLLRNRQGWERCPDGADMMENTRARHAIVEALLSHEKQNLRDLTKRLGIGPELEALCSRLGVNPHNAEWVTWALVGMKLAREQPEFTGKPRGRGRPRKLGDNLDIRRALFIEDANAWAKLHRGRT